MAEPSLQLGIDSGANPRLATLMGELEVTRRFTRSIVRDLSAEDLVTEPDEGKNSIGAVLSHLIAAEALMRRVTTGVPPFPADSEEEGRAFQFGGDPLAGSDLSAYLDALEEARAKTKALFAGKDDAWLDTPRTFLGNPANYHYYWFHLLLDEGRHQGQMILLRKYLIAGADAGFDPYAGLAAAT